MGADVIFWYEHLGPLMQTLKVNTILDYYKVIFIQEALTLNQNCLILISFCSRVKSIDDKFYEKVRKNLDFNRLLI